MKNTLNSKKCKNTNFSAFNLCLSCSANVVLRAQCFIGLFVFIEKNAYVYRNVNAECLFIHICQLHMSNQKPMKAGFKE